MATVVIKDLAKNIKVTDDEMKAITGGLTAIVVPEKDLGTVLEPINKVVASVGILMCSKFIDQVETPQTIRKGN